MFLESPNFHLFGFVRFFSFNVLNLINMCYTPIAWIDLGKKRNNSKSCTLFNQITTLWWCLGQGKLAQPAARKKTPARLKIVDDMKEWKCAGHTEVRLLSIAVVAQTFLQNNPQLHFSITLCQNSTGSFQVCVYVLQCLFCLFSYSLLSKKYKIWNKALVHRNLLRCLYFENASFNAGGLSVCSHCIAALSLLKKIFSKLIFIQFCPNYYRHCGLTALESLLQIRR